MLQENKNNFSEEKCNKIYSDAAGLVEATSYVLRFEKKISAFDSAAKKFESLGDYKDAPEQALKCREASKKARESGAKEVYEMAVKRQKESVAKSDYVDAIANFKRVWKIEGYEEKAKERIDECKKELVKLAGRKARKKKIIFVCILLFLGFIFVQTDAYPFAKGMIHRGMGDYRAAIANFRAATGVPWSKNKIKSSYYSMAEDYLEDKDYDKALSAFKKADNYIDANARAAKLEQKKIRGREIGDMVRFGKGKWQILDKDKKFALLIYMGKEGKSVYSNTPVDDIEESTVFQWMNGTFIKTILGVGERAISFSTNREKSETDKQVSLLLSKEQYEKYKDIIRPYHGKWWLADEGMSTMDAYYVDKEGEMQETYINYKHCHVRPIVWVKIK